MAIASHTILCELPLDGHCPVVPDAVDPNPVRPRDHTIIDHVIDYVVDHSIIIIITTSNSMISKMNRPCKLCAGQSYTWYHSCYILL